MPLNLAGAYSAAHREAYVCHECQAGGHQGTVDFLSKHGGEIAAATVPLAIGVYAVAQNQQIANNAAILKSSFCLVFGSKKTLVVSTLAISAAFIGYSYFLNKKEDQKHIHDEACGHLEYDGELVKNEVSDELCTTEQNSNSQQVDEA